MNALALLASEVGANEPQVLSVPVSELVIGIIAFFVVFGFLSRLALPGVKKALEERTAAIEGGIAKSEQAQAEAEALKAQYEALLAEARTEAAEIRSQAQADRTAIVEQARAEATAAAAAISARADAAISAERSSTVASLQREIGDMALGLASRIVGETLDDDARAQGVVDRFIAELENSQLKGSQSRVGKI